MYDLSGCQICLLCNEEVIARMVHLFIDGDLANLECLFGACDFHLREVCVQQSTVFLYERGNVNSENGIMKYIQTKMPPFIPHLSPNTKTPCLVACCSSQRANDDMERHEIANKGVNQLRQELIAAHLQGTSQQQQTAFSCPQ